MIRLFKRRSPAHRAAIVQPIQISREDRLIAAHWGYTAIQWVALDNHVRTTKRSDYFQAAGL